MKKATHAYYDPETNQVRMADEDGNPLFGSKEDLDDRLEFMAFDSAADRAFAQATGRLCKPWARITKEEWWEALEVLPPEGWTTLNGGTAEVFRMCEYTWGAITMHYIRIRDRYWKANRVPTCPEELIKQVMKQEGMTCTS